ncbi:MAG: PAS domain-containing protein, partial [Thermoanaerobaculia bacterium]|nr:PAS domain-containing protein [Thermoanaerobaculia bacterium]
MEGSTKPPSNLEEEIPGPQVRLEQSLTLLESVLESPQKIAIFSLDRSFRYTAFNSKHRDTMRSIWETEIEVGMNMLEVIGDPEDRAKAQRNFERALTGEQFTEIEAYGAPPHRFHYEDSYNPIIDSSGEVQGLTVFLTDITDRLRQEEELERYRSLLEGLVEERTGELNFASEKLERETRDREKAEALLMRSQRLEALGTLAGGIAHDFNNILTAIVGYTDLLLSDLSRIDLARVDAARSGTARSGSAHSDAVRSDPAPEYLRKIRDAAQHGSTLTSRLLAFSRRQVLQVTPLNLSDVVEQMVDLLHHIVSEDIHLVTELDPTMPNVLVDQGQIEQVLMNLVINARDAMPDGGTLTLRCHADRDRWAVLSVVDEGTGMSPEVVEQIFDPFFTTKESGRGSGLGLAMAYGIVEQHGGSLIVQSTPGEGSNFEIRIPLATAESGQAETSAAPPPTPESTEATAASILIVEDDDAIRTMARILLGRKGHRILEAASFEEAIEAFRDAEGKVDLLFSDVVLPG